MSDQPSQPKETSTRIEPLPRGLLRRLLTAVLWFGLAMLTAWAVAALHFDVRVPWLREPLAVAYAAGVLAVWVFVKRPWLKRGFP